MEALRLRHSKEALHELMATKADADATIRSLEERLRVEKEENERQKEQAQEECKRRHMEDVERLVARVWDLEAQCAKLKREHEEDLLSRIAEFEREMSARCVNAPKFLQDLL